MITILTLFIIGWFMIYTATRFLQYYRILTEYKKPAVATVTEITDHPRKNKKEKPAKDVLLTYRLDDTEHQSEITVPAEAAGKYTVGTELDICCKEDPNGTIHIASRSSANKTIMIGHIAALAVEIAAFILIILFT